MNGLRAAFTSAGTTLLAGLLMLACCALAVVAGWGIFLATGILWIAIPFITLAAPGSIVLGLVLGVRLHRHLTRGPKA